MGPPQADDVLKKAPRHGLRRERPALRPRPRRRRHLATIDIRIEAAEKIGGYDLLICGRHATDAETAQTGPIIAAFLGIPQVTLCGEVEIEDGWAVCERLLPDRTEKVKVKLPALITVCAEANEPRYATPIGIMKALKKPRYTWNAADLGCEPDMIGIPGSPSSNKRIFEPPKRNTDTTYFTGEPEAVAKAIADVLEAEHII